MVPADAGAVAIGEVTPVAAHAWDISGALAADARAAFIARPGMVLSPIGDQPQIIADDLADLAAHLTQEADRAG